MRVAGLLTLCVALTTTLLFASISRAAPGINKTLSFQGRLLSSSGAVVADGRYNIQFKIYQDGAGTAAGNPGGTLKWTETYVNASNNEGVEVKNGYFSVNLGSANPFGTQVDWNQDTLWLSMNIAGASNGCTTFGSAPCTADGEMLPMKRITSTPYALNSGMLEGKTAQNFIQLSQGVQEDTLDNSSSIYINKTGTGGEFLKLQGGGQDVFTVRNNGDVQFGNQSDHAIYVAGANDNEDGRTLIVQSGNGGNGSGNTGGNLLLTGGSGGGTNGNGGSVFIQGGAANGNGGVGSVLIGNFNNAYIEVGSQSLSSGTQTINIGNNNGSGGTTNVTIGSGGGSGGGTTSIQSKNDTTVSTNGTQRARFSGAGDTLYVGNADASGNAATANSFTIQGTSSTGTDTQGGSVSILAGAGTNGNANGGNLVLSGGAGAGTGSNGMVVIGTPAYTMASVQSSSVDTAVSQGNIDGFGIVTLNATGANVDFTLGSPSLGSAAAGRILYVTAANGSQGFMLRANAGGGPGVEQAIPMKQNTTATMIWNGSLWTTAGSAGAGTLQSAYDNSIQTAGNAAIVTVNTTSGDGLIVRQNSIETENSSILSVQSADANRLFSVNSLKLNELATNGGAETAGSSASEFPVSTWKNSDEYPDDPEVPWDSTVTRYTTPGNNIASGSASVKVDIINTYTGTRNKLGAKLTPGVTYKVTAKLRAGSGSNFTNLIVALFPTGTHGEAAPWCADGIAATSSAWTTVDCTFVAPSNVNSNNGIFITSESETGTFYVDDLSVTRTTASSNVQIGSDTDEADPTYLTLGKSAAAPVENSDALLGSMYYDTALGKVQCLEADGWGACGAAPDTFVTLSPEFANAVTNGSGTGSMSSDICSDTLNINDGSSDQPTVCGTNETYNFYKWTSGESTAQTKSIYVTYQLPANFKNFVANNTSLLGRTNDADANVTYQIYRNNSSEGLTACGSAVSVSTGDKTTWQKATASGSADPSTCDFEAGDSIVFRINMAAQDDANAYVSNLGFVYSNN